MKRISKLFAATTFVATAALLAAGAPAGAATSGGGEVAGTVSITGSTSPGGGIPTLSGGSATTTYLFNSIVLNGAFTDGSNAFAGQISVTGVGGGSNIGAESFGSGEGYVADFPFSGLGVGAVSGTCKGYDALTNGHPSHGSAFSPTGGGYSRVGSVVLVKLQCTATVQGGPSQPATVYVVAQFTPTQGDGVTTDIKAASFTGAFETGVALT